MSESDLALPAAISPSLGTEAQPPRSRNRFLRKFVRHRLAVAGGLVLTALLLSAVLAPWIAPYDPNRGDFLNIDASPSWDHPLGTDGNGRDYWSRLLYGSRVSLSVGIVATMIAATIGTLLGTFSGYYRGFVDLAIQRLTELVMTFPSLLVIITLVAFLGPSLVNIMAVFGLLGWTSFCRIVRGQVLSVREMAFVEAAKTIGSPNGIIMRRHILPNVLPYIIVYGTLNVAGIILAEASLSFLGLGVQAPTPTWGNMLWAAQTLDTLVNRPLRWIAPGTAIMLCVLSINLLGDGLRDALDPRSRPSS